MDDGICPDCGQFGTNHDADCHVGWAEHLKDTPSVVPPRNPFLAMLKGHDEQSNQSSDGPANPTG